MVKVKKGLILVSLLFFLGIFFLMEADDKELFVGAGLSPVKPNVIILMDSSGSMNTIIFFPLAGDDGIVGNADDGYDQKINYAGTLDSFGLDGDSYWTTTETRWRARWVLADHAYTDNNWTGIYNKEDEDKILCGSNGQGAFQVGDWIINRNGTAVARIKTITDCNPVLDSCGSWLELEERQGTFQLGSNGDDNCLEIRDDGSQCRPVYMYGADDNGNPVRYPRNYLKWLFLYATDEQRASVSHFSTYGTFDTGDFATGTPSPCITPGHERILKRFTRIQVIREVACEIAEESLDIVNLGLFRFDGSNGGYLLESLTDMSESASELVDYKNKVYLIEGNAWTPLAEALADVWYYLRPGPSSKPYWPVNMDTAASSTYEMDYYCQNNYVVILTDGESTYDEFSGDIRFDNSMFRTISPHRQEPWNSWYDGWGDPDHNDVASGIPANYTPLSAIYCPNWTCWQRIQTNGANWYGTDYLDDVAYFMSHSDLFPEENYNGTLDLYTDFPGIQSIYTYTIGFTADNDLLRATAINGDGAYYTANDYDQLVSAFRRIFTSIMLRNFGFSAITAPKKTASTLNNDLSVSYVGYFLPSTSAPIWEGHLLAYELLDLWGYDMDNNGSMEFSEYIYDSEGNCLGNSTDKPCSRYVDLKPEHHWDAADKIPFNRNLYTHFNSITPISFDLGNMAQLKPYFGAGTTDIEAQMIIEKISEPQLADVFHSDVIFVGPPLEGKKYLPYTNSLDAGAESYLAYYLSHLNRRRVLFTGTNDGILHMFYADDPGASVDSEAGTEVWGFIPDEVLPTLKEIIIGGSHQYTVDGRITAQDLYFPKGANESPSWSTVLAFGLRGGGNAYYQLDVTEVASQPNIMWKFEDADHSGQSWGKPIYGRIKLANPLDSEELIDRWVVILAGGFAYNYENSNDLRGKAVFIVDAGTGELLWMTGFHPDGESDSGNTSWLDTASSDDIRHLTSDPVFNYPIPSSLVAVDDNQDGYLDSLFYGNMGGHFFRTDIDAQSMDNWHTYNIFKSQVETRASARITAVSSSQITVETDVFEMGQTVRGSSSYAMGAILNIENNVLTVETLEGTFVVGENLLKRSYDPIYISPAVAWDTCSNLWISYGTGDRDRPRTNPDAGRFLVYKDPGSGSYDIDSLTQLTWSGDSLATGEGVVINTGWYFDFYEADDFSSHEILFDPEPVVLPDKNLVPHLFFNTYTSPGDTSLVSLDDPCEMPGEGLMTLYDIALVSCGETVAGLREEGRIAGGGIYKGKEYVMYVGKGGVASVPPLEDTEPVRLPYPGGVLFWKERRR